MCRVLGYLGEDIRLTKLLYEPDNSLIRQTLSQYMLNLAGFGMVSWQQHSDSHCGPLVYRTTQVAIFDRNLHAIANQLQTSCLIAHVRGVPYNELSDISHDNIHPFHYPGEKIALAHNGDIYHYPQIKREIFQLIDAETASRITGSSDSELIYALVTHYLKLSGKPTDAKQTRQALRKALEALAIIRKGNQIDYHSPVNLFIGGGDFIITTRFTYNYGNYAANQDAEFKPYLSLWYARGNKYTTENGQYKMEQGDEKDAFIVSSEPLTQDSSTWIEVPEYSLLTAQLTKSGKIDLEIEDLDY